MPLVLQEFFIRDSFREHCFAPLSVEKMPHSDGEAMDGQTVKNSLRNGFWDHRDLLRMSGTGRQNQLDDELDP